MSNPLNPAPVEYAAGPWVLLDQHEAVVEIVTTAEQVIKFIDAQRADGLGFDIDTMEGRCGECGEATAIDGGDQPHAPKCPADEFGYGMTVGEIVDELRASIDLFERVEHEEDEQAIDAGRSVVNYVEALLKRLQPRSVDDFTTAVTVDHVDVHFETIGDVTTVSVGAEDTPAADRRVFVQDWSGTEWSQEIKG